MIETLSREWRRAPTGHGGHDALVVDEGYSRDDRTGERTADASTPTDGEDSSARHVSERRSDVRRDVECGDPTAVAVDDGGG